MSRDYYFSTQEEADAFIEGVSFSEKYRAIDRGKAPNGRYRVEVVP